MAGCPDAGSGRDGGNVMENEWETFWQSGKVKDYLEYREHTEGFRTEGKDADTHETVRRADGNRVNCDADWRV